MKKTYNAPVLNIIEVQSTMLAGSDPTMAVDPSKNNPGQLSKEFNVSFEDDEEDMSYGW